MPAQIIVVKVYIANPLLVNGIIAELVRNGKYFLTLNMYHQYYPRGPVAGPIEPPVSYSHFATIGSIPKKCAGCGFLFKGACTRSIDVVQRYLHLDFGPCGIHGPTEPVYYEDQFIKSRSHFKNRKSLCNLGR